MVSKSRIFQIPIVAYFNPHMGFKFRLSATAKGLS